MKLATQNKDFLPVEIASKLETVRTLGFDGYEIDGKLLLDQFEQVQTAIKKTGMPVVSACGGYRGWIGDFDAERRQTALADIARILEALSTIGGTGIIVPAAWGMFSLRLPPMVPPRPAEEDRKVLLDSLNYLDRIAGKTGAFVFLEPLNRYEDHMINTLREARSLIDGGNFSHVRIMADFYHMNIEEAKINESILEQKGYIGHVHLADSHRYQPGSGHTDFVAGFKALREIGFNGYMTYECRVMGGNPAEEYRRSVAFIKDCLTK